MTCRRSVCQQGIKYRQTDSAVIQRFWPRLWLQDGKVSQPETGEACSGREVVKTAGRFSHLALWLKGSVWSDQKRKDKPTSFVEFVWSAFYWLSEKETELECMEVCAVVFFCLGRKTEVRVFHFFTFCEFILSIWRIPPSWNYSDYPAGTKRCKLKF